mmetsp:Transcript_10148/g.8682  ORF Transcript_10148/g.8682 Transcript_10148/m.8682 type:complete len:94 (+) Transcript_10148:38-319(+)
MSSSPLHFQNHHYFFDIKDFLIGASETNIFSKSIKRSYKTIDQFKFLKQYKTQNETLTIKNTHKLLKIFKKVKWSKRLRIDTFWLPKFPSLSS